MQLKFPVRVTKGANTPDLPKVVSWVPLMVQVPPGCAHFVQPEGASAAAKALPANAIVMAPIKAPNIVLLRIRLSPNMILCISTIYQ
ncbi:MAG TPA: hypothetical protein VFW00_02485 [Rhodocyclaceae bacterium]|nr:hypothetical protein [Rhodocyclaceae bacterium]